MKTKPRAASEWDLKNRSLDDLQRMLGEVRRELKRRRDRERRKAKR